MAAGQVQLHLVRPQHLEQIQYSQLLLLQVAAAVEIILPLLLPLSQLVSMAGLEVVEVIQMFQQSMEQVALVTLQALHRHKVLMAELVFILQAN